MSNEFLDDLFRDQEGVVYAPVKQVGGAWKQHFFNYPSERENLEEHLQGYDRGDIYLSPVLFTDRRISPETFKGTFVLWTEFDGAVPTEAIQPTMRVMSSQEGHEHWYWKLDRFETNRKLVEDLTRRIAYHYGADLSVWDYQNVLRPVDTWNHKRNKPVTLVDRTEKYYSISDFLQLPVSPSSTRVSISLGELPKREEILANYKWKLDTLDLLFKDMKVGSRSIGLVRLAMDAIEVGCSNEEIYVLLEERDRAWGKYVGRTDREKQLQNCISYARSKKIEKAESDVNATEVYRFNDFMKTKIRLKWCIEGLLPVAGSMVLLGREGVGKSTFLLRLLMAVSLGHEYFLNWKIINRQKTLFVSLEMQHGELKQFFEDMNISEEEQEELQEWFHIWPIGHAYPFDTPDQQLELLKYIDLHKIELVVIDSLGLSMYGSIKNDDDVKRLNSFMNEDIRKERKCSYIFIHHLRKRQGNEDPKKPVDIDESFGSRYITANAQTVALLSQKPNSPRLHMHLQKTRMVMGAKDFDIERTSDRGFRLVGELNDSKPAVTKSENGESTSDEGRAALSLGKLFEV